MTTQEDIDAFSDYNKTCIKCSVSLEIGNNIHDFCVNKKWYLCKSCHDSTQNGSRMYVNGRYVSRMHPLYKAGNYKSFDDAAFSSLTNYNTTTSGHVYAMTNAAWPEWIKIGKAVDAEDRLRSYQTSSPLRDYTLIHYAYSDDRNVAEKQAHALAVKLGSSRNEWFKISNEDAIIIIEQVGHVIRPVEDCQ